MRGTLVPQQSSKIRCVVFFFYENHLILSWNYSKILEWKYFITPWLFTSFWPKPILLSQCLPASNTENRCLWQVYTGNSNALGPRWCFVKDFWITCTFEGAAMITLRWAPALTMNSQSNLQHLRLLSPKASIYGASMVGKQALSVVLQRIQSRTDSIQLGYSGNTCWEHMLGFWEQQGTHM